VDDRAVIGEPEDDADGEAESDGMKLDTEWTFGRF